MAGGLGGCGTGGLRAGGLAGWRLAGWELWGVLGFWGVLIFAFAEIWRFCRGGLGFLGGFGGREGAPAASFVGALKAMLLSDLVHCEG